jgi:uncharacterized membrane protein
VIDYVAVLSRWVHVVFAVLLLGGSLFVGWVLTPAATAVLTDEQHQALRERVNGIWKKLVMAAVGLLLLSGFYNYLVVALPLHKGDGLYHALMGTKIILALVVFFIASALVGRSPGLQKIRDNRRTWLRVGVTLGVLVVLIAGFLKVRGVAPKTAEPAPATVEE